MKALDALAVALGGSRAEWDGKLPVTVADSGYAERGFFLGGGESLRPAGRREGAGPAKSDVIQDHVCNSNMSFDWQHKLELEPTQPFLPPPISLLASLYVAYLILLALANRTGRPHRFATEVSLWAIL